MNLKILFFIILILYNTIFYVKETDGHDFFKKPFKSKENKKPKKGMKCVCCSLSE